MQLSATVRLLAVAAGLALGADLDYVKPSSFIVEYKSGITKRDDIFARDLSIKVVRDFHSDIFHGAHVESDKHTLQELRSRPEVNNVWPNRRFKPQRAVPRATGDANGVTDSPPGSDIDPAQFDVHNSTGVWALHQQGIKGKGAKVAVVDTGVDYTHPDLGGGFGPGFKVAGGYDLAGDGDWPTGPRQPDDDPMATQIDHGTHVAGIVAGQGEGWSGVAPEATIYAYKTYAADATDEAINLDAFLMAYEQGVDIITASIGLGGGWAEGAIEEVATRLANKGVVITVSIGNGGDGGPFRALSPSGARGVIAVSNIDTNAYRTDDIPIPRWDTSWGSLFDLQMKPDVGAPGSSIYSTVFNHGWAVYSGTSMSTPYLAGVAALYVGKYGGRNTQHGVAFAKHMHNRLVSNVRKVQNNGWSDDVAPVAQIGSGLVNATAVLAPGTDLEFEPMALNDTRFFRSHHKINVINNGNQTVEYLFSKEDAMGANTLGNADYNNIIQSGEYLSLNDFSVNVTLPEKLTLAPGASKTVTVSFQNPDKSNWYKPSMPLYGGNVVVSSSTGERLSVPFMGIGADLKGSFKQMFLGSNVVKSLDPPVEHNETSSPSFSFNLTAQDFPILFAGIGWGTRQLRYDIFEKGYTEGQWSWPLVPGKHGYVGSATWWVGAGQVPKWFDDQGWNPDETNDYPRINTGRNVALPSYDRNEYWWFGKLTDGKKISEGDYVMRFAALLPFGQPETSEDWDAWTMAFTVTGQYESTTEDEG